ncbi:MAG: DNA mismatch repair protein MutS [Verrucomicrobiota bacterium]
MAGKGETPMMQQYQRIKREVPADAILLFRLGDFYEMFFDDAAEAAGILDVALTKRQGMPMCGVPYHAAEGYIAKLIAAGKRVAVCDQTETPKPGQIVRREVTQIISPGSVLDSRLLDAKANNFLAALWQHHDDWGLAVLDLSTGEFRAGELAGPAAVADALGRATPSEIIVPAEAKPELPERAGAANALVVPYDDWTFSPDAARLALLDHFQTQSLDGYGMENRPAATGAAGALLHYLSRELKRDLAHVRTLAGFRRDDVLVLDATTRANLDVVASERGGREATLLHAIDRTATAGGARRLRAELLQPPRELETIHARQEAVAFWHEHERERDALREHLRGIRDLERLIARLSQGGGNARDLAALADSLERLPAIKEALQPRPQDNGWDGRPQPPALLRELAGAVQPLPELLAELRRALVEEPPVALKDGGMFRAGFRADLDELLDASQRGKEWLAQLQLREQQRTGIKSLKVRFNQVFGYFIEISKSNLDAVPEDYTRKQTMANAERFITPELKEMEGKILGAEERAQQLEYEFFLELRAQAVAEIDAVQATARALSLLDVLAGWALLAQERDYARPTVDDSGVLEITDGRHPVLEQLHDQERFVPNDARLHPEDQRLVILTGPNMAGKSTYIRQVALIALLAHCGCFVPARSARVGRLDRIFTRVGASDDLSRGQSTFMVEMNETANILNHATARSLVILDEIGRGTSTFDGLSIAWSVAEHLHTEIRAKALFATHYHELTELAVSLPGVKNYNVAVREWGEKVVFLRKIVEGGADKSYGIQVARLAGLPPSVLDRAKEILRQLEEGELDETGKPKLAKRPPEGAAATPSPAPERRPKRKLERSAAGSTSAPVAADHAKAAERRVATPGASRAAAEPAGPDEFSAERAEQKGKRTPTVPSAGSAVAGGAHVINAETAQGKATEDSTKGDSVGSTEGASTVDSAKDGATAQGDATTGADSTKGDAAANSARKKPARPKRPAKFVAEEMDLFSSLEK